MTMNELVHRSHSVVRDDNGHLDHAALAKALKLPRARNGEQRRIFWNHRSDTFHPALSNDEIAAQFGVMATRPDLTFLVSTKWARRMREWFEWAATYPHGDGTGTIGGSFSALYKALSEWPGELPGIDHDDTGGALERALDKDWPLPNVWLGVSVEDQGTADERIPDLLATPAAKRFVSYEPALGPVDLDPSWCPHGDTQRYGSGDDGVFCEHCGAELAGQGWLDGGKRGPVDWVICGSESGPGARHAPLEWVRSVRNQVLDVRSPCDTCRTAGWLLPSGKPFYPGSIYEGGEPCTSCDGRGWHGPALFIKQWDVCEVCDGDGHLLDGDRTECSACDGTGQTGKVRKGCPAIDGRVWHEVP